MSTKAVSEIGITRRLNAIAMMIKLTVLSPGREGRREGRSGNPVPSNGMDSTPPHSNNTWEPPPIRKAWTDG